MDQTRIGPLAYTRVHTRSQRSHKLPKSDAALNTTDTPISHKTVSVVVVLTPQDYKKGIVAAKSSNENIAEWISGLVNTALQP
jgi:hypothetical protein